MVSPKCQAKERVEQVMLQSFHPWDGGRKKREKYRGAGKEAGREKCRIYSTKNQHRSSKTGESDQRQVSQGQRA